MTLFLASHRSESHICVKHGSHSRGLAVETWLPFLIEFILLNVDVFRLILFVFPQFFDDLTIGFLDLFCELIRFLVIPPFLHIVNHGLLFPVELVHDDQELSFTLI